MAEEYCSKVLDSFVKLVHHRRSSILAFCVLHFTFSLVATLGNLLVIRALIKASTIPANVRKMFISLAFSDLAVGLLPQLMDAIIYAVVWKMASKGDNLAFLCPTVLSVFYYFCYLLVAASFLNVTIIAGDRLLAVSLHLRYQELVTARRVTTVLASVWIISCVFPILNILFPKEIEMVTAVISLIGYAVTTAAYVRIYKVVKYHQNQIYSENHLQNAQTREAHRQRKSAYNSLFVSVVFFACYFPFLPCTILYEINTSEVSFVVAQVVSVFLIWLNSSLNPIVYCWRYREIRQSVKSTVKKLFHMNDSMS